MKEVDLWKLSEFMYDARKNTIFDTESRTLEHIYEHRKKLTSDHNMILTAYENDTIVGILRIFTGFPEMAFTSLWDPMITQEEGRERREEIALDLIRVGKKFVKEQGFSRLEVLLSPLTEKHSKIYAENKSWYEKSGFYKATEEVLLQVELENYELPSPQPSALTQASTVIALRSKLSSELPLPALTLPVEPSNRSPGLAAPSPHA